MRLPARLTPHAILIKEAIGRNHNGVVLGPSRVIPRVKVDEGRKYTTQSGDTATSVSATRIYIRPEGGPIPLGSEITAWAGTDMEKTGTVVEVNWMDHPPAPSHFVVLVV